MVIKNWIDKAKESLNINNSENNKLTVSDDTKTSSSNDSLFFEPNANICTCEDDLLMEVDLPGIDKNELKINYENEILNIEANIDLKEYEGLSPIYTEYRVGNYSRKFKIGNSYDTEKIAAALNDGVLTIKIPKREQMKARLIEIK